MKAITSLYIALLFPILSFSGNNAGIVIPGQDQSRIPFLLDVKLVPGQDYLENTIIFKIKPQYRQNCKRYSIDNILPLQDFLNNVGATGLEKIFPHHSAPAAQRNQFGQEFADLSLVYSFKYTSARLLESVINQMRISGYYEYVEPWYIPKPMSYTPNDNSGQYHLQGNVIGSINTEDAWDLTKGNASVIVGIVDTGTDSTHIDLASNYKGGYDVAMNDPNPSYEPGQSHGIQICGASSAVTDNGIGIASPGFNCGFKAIKVTNPSGQFISAYPGIVWAADNGCKIINCSWGGTPYSAYEQSVIDYAAINKNCLVICSSGNGGVTEFLYPGSYHYTYRVSASNNGDSLATFSSKGCDVDFSAPGKGIMALSPSSWAPVDGTSIACAVASGSAALIQSYLNYTNAFQIGEKLKQTCDPYTGVSTLNLYNSGLLGKGRIDVYNALTQPAKSILLTPINITDGNDDIFMPGETLSLSGTFVNYLDPCTPSAAATLSVLSGPGTVINGNYTIGALGTLGTNVMSAPFTVNIHSNAGINTIIKFNLTITDGAFTNSLCFELPVNSNTTSTPDTEPSISFDLLPNPTKGPFKIYGSGFNTASVHIFDVVGKKVVGLEAQQPSFTFDISDQPAGIYFIRVESEKGILTRKIIKE